MRFVILILFLGACDTPSNSWPINGPKSEVAPTPKPSANEMISWMPRDARLFVEFDMASMRKSQVWGEYKQQLGWLMSPSYSAYLCRDDLWLRQPKVAMSATAEHALLLVQGAAFKDKDTCLRKLQSEPDESFGDLAWQKLSPAIAAVYDKSTGSALSRDFIRQKSMPQSPHTNMRRLLRSVDRSADVWGGFLTEPGDEHTWADVTTFQLWTGSHVTGSVTLSFKNIQRAISFMDGVESVQPLVATPRALMASRSGGVVTVDVDVSTDDIASLMQAAIRDDF